MTWARGLSREVKHGRVYLHQPEPGLDVPAPMLAGAFLGAVGALLVVLVTDAITVGGRHEAVLVLLGVPLLIALMVFSIYVLQNHSARRKLVRSAYLRCGVEVPSAEEYAELSELRVAATPIPGNVADELEGAYQQLVQLVVADGLVEEDELERLTRTEAALSLSPERIEKARLQGFMDVYDRAMEDGILTLEEQASISHIREALEVPERLVRQELAFAKELSRAHDIRDVPLTPIRVGVRLPGSERAFYTTMATEKKRVIRTYRQDGEDVPSYAYESVRSGNLIITDGHVLVEAGTVKSIGLDRIIKVGVDARTKYLAIHQNGHKHPRFFDVPQPYMAMVFVERMLEQSTRPESSS